MLNITVSSLKGSEVLGKDIINSSGVILIPQGTILKKEYIDKLVELNIYSVYVKNIDTEDNMELESSSEIIMECTTKIKKIIEKQFYSTNTDLEKVAYIAEDLMQEVLNQPEVVMTVNNIRHNSEDLYQHSVSVCATSVLIGLQMQLEKSIIKDISIGALLHDIGYTYVNSLIKNNNISDKEIIDKEKKKHVLYGYEMIKSEEWVTDSAKNIILCHHEKFDGKGYPFKRKGFNIDIGSRIVAIANAFDNYVNGKSCEAMKVYEAIDKIVKKSESNFDGNIVSAFRNCVAAYPTGTIVITNEHEIGIVINQNRNLPTRPVIKIIRNKEGKDILNGRTIDLKSTITITIVDTIE